MVNKKLDDGENELLEKFTHVIELKDDSEYNIDPHFGEDKNVDSLDFFRSPTCAGKISGPVLGF